jgi:hypothetical protein
VQEREGNTLEAIGKGNDFLNRTEMAQQLRERIDKRDYMKLKSFCTTKLMVSNSRRTDLEKIFASYTSDKGLITKLYRELKIKTKQTNKKPKKQLPKTQKPNKKKIRK